MSVLNENQLMGASGAGTSDYEIEQSLRLNIDTPKWIKRTPSSDSNRKTWTLSMWHKRGAVGRNLTEILFKGGGSGGSGIIAMHLTNSSYAAEDKIWLSFDGATGANPVTNRVFRDPSGWMHIVLRFDTTQSTVTDRARLYINGELIISTDYTFLWSTSWAGITQNSDWNVNKSGIEHSFGAHQTNQPLDGYLADIAFVDGQSLGPDSFGETGDYGEWKPIDVSGLTFGTNGYHLDFADSSALGNDANGSNNFTTVGIAATDQMLDSPTNNFCTLNPLDKTSVMALSEGNLKSVSSGNGKLCGTMLIPSSGKWLFEYLVTAGGGADVGLAKADILLTSRTQEGANVIDTRDNNTTVFVEGTAHASEWASTYGTNVVVQMQVDMDAGTILYKTGTDSTSAISFTSTEDWVVWTENNSDTLVFNFGSDSSFAGAKTPQGHSDSGGIGDFYYAPPNSYLSLCSANLPSVDVIPSEHFNTVLYTGTGSSNAVTGVGFAPNFTWAKSRSNADGNGLVNDVAGATRLLSSNTTDADSVSANYFASLDSDGFTVGTSTFANRSGASYVAWNWKAGGTAVSNTNGTITSSVSANPSAGFSIVTYTGNGTAGATVGHGLSKIPDMIITKGRSNTGVWVTWQKDLTGAFNSNGAYVYLNSTGQPNTTTVFYDGTGFTSSVFKWRGGNENVNQSSRTYLSYCFNNVDGFLKTGTYGGNGSTNGPFVHCGFKPAFLMLRNIGSSGEWIMQDDARQTFNADAAYNLSANRSVEENNGTYLGGPTNANNVDWLSNGFKIRADNGNCNASGGTFLFIAFAETPSKFSNAR